MGMPRATLESLIEVVALRAGAGGIWANQLGRKDGQISPFPNGTESFNTEIVIPQTANRAHFLSFIAVSFLDDGLGGGNLEEGNAIIGRDFNGVFHVFHFSDGASGPINSTSISLNISNELVIGFDNPNVNNGFVAVTAAVGPAFAPPFDIEVVT